MGDAEVTKSGLYIDHREAINIVLGTQIRTGGQCASMGIDISSV